jgi:hypothetical protein
MRIHIMETRIKVYCWKSCGALCPKCEEDIWKFSGEKLKMVEAIDDVWR